MELTGYLIRPTTFRTGRDYLYQGDAPTSEEYGLPVNMTPVHFVAYDACPAYVIVKNGGGKRWRCLRDQIFEVRTLI